MRIYVGYIMVDYSTPVCVGLDKKSVEIKLKEYKSFYGTEPWIESYNIQKNIAIELNNN